MGSVHDLKLPHFQISSHPINFILSSLILYQRILHWKTQSQIGCPIANLRPSDVKKDNPKEVHDINSAETMKELQVNNRETQFECEKKVQVPQEK